MSRNDANEPQNYVESDDNDIDMDRDDDGDEDFGDEE